MGSEFFSSVTLYFSTLTFFLQMKKRRRAYPTYQEYIEIHFYFTLNLQYFFKFMI